MATRLQISRQQRALSIVKDRISKWEAEENEGKLAQANKELEILQAKLKMVHD